MLEMGLASQRNEVSEECNFLGLSSFEAFGICWLNTTGRQNPNFQ